MKAVIGVGPEELGIDQLIDQESFCGCIRTDVEARPHHRDSAGTEPTAAFWRALGVDQKDPIGKLSERFRREIELHAARCRDADRNLLFPIAAWLDHQVVFFLNLDTEVGEADWLHDQPVCRGIAPNGQSGDVRGNRFNFGHLRSP